MEIDRHNSTDAADDRVAAREQAAIHGAVADRDNPFRIRRRVVSALQGFAHVFGDRPGHQEHIGMPRRSDEAQAKTFEIVEGVAERVDFQLAAIAGAGIDLRGSKDCGRAAPRRAVRRSRLVRQVPRRLAPAAFRSAGVRKAFKQRPAHRGS